MRIARSRHTSNKRVVSLPTAFRRDYTGKPITFDGREYPDYPGMAIWYAETLVNRKIPACKWTILAGERFLRMLDKAESGRFKGDQTPFEWSPGHLIDVCDFEEKLPHVEGHSGLLVLQPWQIFANAMVWGFRRRNGARLARVFYEWEPRGHGKSFRAATRLLFCMTCEGENGPLGYICGAKDKDAHKVYDPLRKIIEVTPDLKNHYGIKTTLNEIRFFGEEGKVQRVLDTNELEEGHNPHVVVMEELHKQHQGLFEVMRSALGKRMNPLFMSISTAGKNASGLGWQEWKYCLRILTGEARGEHVAALIYAVDEGEEERILDPAVVAKANPGLNISIDADQIKEQAYEAIEKPINRAEFKRTRFNIWGQGAGNIIDGVEWDKCEDSNLDIHDFVRRKCSIACDLASRRDLASICALFERGKDIVAFSRNYICADAEIFNHEDVGPIFEQWKEDGWLVVQEGGMIDFDEIEKDVMAWCRAFEVEAVVVDDYQANQFAGGLKKKRIPVFIFKKVAKYTSEPTDDLVTRIKSRNFRHDGNPVLRFCALNVVGRRDENNNILPKRDRTQPQLKIDAIESVIMANASRLAFEKPTPSGLRQSVYAERGLLGSEE